MNLKPARLRRKGQKVYWTVRVGKRLSGSSRAKKHYFKKRKDASDFITNLAEANERLGQAIFSLTLEQHASTKS